MTLPLGCRISECVVSDAVATGDRPASSDAGVCVFGTVRAPSAI